MAAAERRRPATREDHDEFCLTERWTLTRGASGKPVQHHRTYELALWDGRILRTRISRPVDRSEYAKSMWSHILRDQLEVSAEAFWLCVRDGTLPDRGTPQPERSDQAVPLYLVRALAQMGLPESEILELTPAEAAARYAHLLAEPPTK